MRGQKALIDRRIERARDAGRRWQSQAERRAVTARRLSEGGPKKADSPERVERYTRREEEKKTALLRFGLPSTAFLERRIGPTLDLDDDAPSDSARTAGLPVARVVALGARNEITDGFATAFLIAGNLAITNHHVFSSADECDGCALQFGYERVTGTLRMGTLFVLILIPSFTQMNGSITR